jgi:hypothetical protein
MDATFRFRRQSCRPLWDATVRLTATASSGFTVRSSQNVSDSLSPDKLRAVILGVASAYAALEVADPVSVVVQEVIDHSGTTSELGLNVCAEAAAFQLLGFPERAPFPGVFSEA